MKVMAHRGYSGAYPENTMLAFRKAVETGCDGIELDVHAAGDGQLVILHDERIDRTTDGHGSVRDYSLGELRRFNAAARWEGEFAPEPIPSFEEYCSWLAGQKVFTNVEIKTDNCYYPGIERRIWDTVVKYGVETQVMFSSFNHISLLHMQRLIPPEVELGALTLDEGGVHVFPGEYCGSVGFQCWHPGIRVLNEENVRSCRERGVKIHVWTVDDMGGLERLCALGVDGVITNYPGAAVNYLRGRQL